jgi:hypothetical protein
MQDRTNHNALAEQFAARLRADPDPAFVDRRLRELAAFESRAQGFAPHFSKQDTTAATAAKVATATGETEMNMHHTETLSRPSSLFQPAASSSAYLKMGIMGKQGAGKSMTAAKTAIGLVNHMKQLGVEYADKPVAWFDTETGSDWLIPKFKTSGIDLVVAKKRSFADLLEAVRWAEGNASALIIDSITHPWRELLDSYMKSKKRTFMQIADWGYVKGPYGWQQFSDLFVNSKLHIIMAGRAGDDLEQYTDEDGKQQLEKVGIKMKTEGETGFEPSLLVLMEREMNTHTNKTVHRAYIMKDRSTLLDGAEFDDPDFSNFLPHIRCLNLGGAHVGVQVTGDSQHILKTEKRDWQPVQRKIVLGEIQDLMVLHVPGQAAADKQRRITLLKTNFGAGWVEIEETMPLIDLRAGYDSLHRALEGVPSRYGVVLAKDAESLDINDSLPDAALPNGVATLAATTAAVTETLEPVEPAAPATDVDEAKWLAELHVAFGKAVDLVSWGATQQTLMAPRKRLVTEASWKKAVAIATSCMKRLMNESGGAAVAAE